MLDLFQGCHLSKRNSEVEWGCTSRRHGALLTRNVLGDPSTVLVLINVAFIIAHVDLKGGRRG